MTTTNKIAVLIDGDNAESALVEQILGEAGRYGKVTVKRIYADWTDIRMKSWKDKINAYAIRPIQKFAYTTGKNSTDSALIIDAMDLLHSKNVDGFCIVSSDSDYTGIAHRIREEGLFVMGIGRSHTPEAFVKACENFTYSEILVPSQEVREGRESRQPQHGDKKDRRPDKGSKTIKDARPVVAEKIDLKLIGSLKESGLKPIDFNQIDTAFNMVVNEDTGLALLSTFGPALRKIDPTFDPRNFGFATFRKFCESLSANFEMIKHKDGSTLSLKKRD